MLKTRASLVVGVLFLSGPFARATPEEDGCREIESWDGGSGAYVEVPSALHGVVAIDAGDIFSVALRRNGQVVAWGEPPNDPAELTGGPWSQPYRLPQEAQFRATAIAAGQEHGTILTTDGVMYEWHQDVTPAHALVPGDHTDVIALAAGGDGPIQDVWNGQPHYPFLLMLHADGSITVRGDNVAGSVGNTAFSIQALPEFTGPLQAVAAGRSHALALTLDGQVIGWGSDDDGETTIPNTVQKGGVIAIAAGKDHSLAVRSDGTVVAWGGNGHGQCEVPRDLAGVVAVAGGEGHSIALRSDGTLVAWGSNEFGQCELPPTPRPVRAIACGRWHSVALDAGGTILAWGDDRYGQCGVSPARREDLSTVVGLAVGAEHRLALNADGSVVAWGEARHGQTEVPAILGSSMAIAAGEHHSMALEIGGTVVAWGDNDLGQCDVPAGVRNAIAIAAGRRHSLALLAGGTVVGWGANDANQCDVPRGLTDVIAIAAGEEHSLALRMNGTVVAWGGDAFGQAQPPSGLSNIRSIAAGRLHSLAVRNDGVVFAWGANGRKECDVPSDLPPVVSVQAGTRYSIALTIDGGIIAWGDCGERRPGPPFANRFYPATFPAGIGGHVLLAAGPTGIMAVRDTCPPCSPGDFNRDDVVDEVDLAFFFTVLGQACLGDESEACAADLNHDGGVGLDDLSLLLRYWGPCESRTIVGLRPFGRG